MLRPSPRFSPPLFVPHKVGLCFPTQAGDTPATPPKIEQSNPRELQMDKKTTPNTFIDYFAGAFFGLISGLVYSVVALLLLKWAAIPVKVDLIMTSALVFAVIGIFTGPILFDGVLLFIHFLTGLANGLDEIDFHQEYVKAHRPLKVASLIGVGTGVVYLIASVFGFL